MDMATGTAMATGMVMDIIPKIKNKVSIYYKIILLIYISEIKKMKIGIVTFHWAINYGAVLQAFALQGYLQKRGCDVEIIDYCPSWARDVKSIDVPHSLRGLVKCINEIWRRRTIAHFRRMHLNISRRRYKKMGEISDWDNYYDLVIVGSDQVFNPDIIASSGELDKVYLLDYTNKKSRKACYAASFGNSSLKEQYSNDFKNKIEGFSYVGIREKSGVCILENLNINSGVWVLDPTILFNDYTNLIVEKTRDEKYIFEFIFQKTDRVKQYIQNVSEFYNCSSLSVISLVDWVRNKKGILFPSPEKWISTIKFAEFIVTDSFHCTVFCILMHRPFISLALDAWGADWCERMKSLLERIGLSDRLLLEFNDEDFKRLLASEIDWSLVDAHIASWKEECDLFFDDILNEAH